MKRWIAGLFLVLIAFYVGASNQDRCIDDPAMPQQPDDEQRQRRRQREGEQEDDHRAASLASVLARAEWVAR